MTLRPNTIIVSGKNSLGSIWSFKMAAVKVLKINNLFFLFYADKSAVIL